MTEMILYVCKKKYPKPSSFIVFFSFLFFSVTLSFYHSVMGKLELPFPLIPPLKGPCDAVSQLKVRIANVGRQGHFKVRVDSLLKLSCNPHNTVSLVGHFASGSQLFGACHLNDLAPRSTPPVGLQQPIRDHSRLGPTFVRVKQDFGRVALVAKHFTAALASAFVIE